MIEPDKLSKEYTVRRIEDEDIDEVYELYLGNPMYFEYYPPEASRDTVIADKTALPPRTGYDRKYYVGYYKDNKLVAVLDLIERYPDKERCFIGFFMMKKEEQEKGIGTDIICELCEYLKSIGYGYIRLFYVKDNPQAKHFWEKNGFKPTGKISKALQYELVMMEKEIDNLT